MKMTVPSLLPVASLALAAVVVPMAACADVWQDCAAWYMGGASTVGPFNAGDMTDLRHAADPSSPTHGGARGGISSEGVSNLVETVYSAASETTMSNQRTIYMAQQEKFDSGVYKVAEDWVELPFAATTNTYTLLARIRLDETQPTNQTFVGVLNFGFNADGKCGFGLRYYPASENLQIMSKGDSNWWTGNYKSPTNDVCTTLRGKWLEISVTVSQPTETTRRIRVGIGAQGLQRTYEQKEPTASQLVNVRPSNGKIFLGSTSHYGSWSTQSSAFRGSCQMIAYWERVLTDEEILEAFRQEGFSASYKSSTSVLKVGDPAYGAEMLGGTADEDVTLASADLQDIGKFPGAIAAGKTVKIPFTVVAECTNLPQVVRLTGAAADSATFDVSVDDVSVGSLSASGGGTAQLLASADLFTQGDHVLALTRTDAGEAAFRTACAEISGSWRIGWMDASSEEMGGDLGWDAMKTYAVDQLIGPADGTNYWSSVRSNVTLTRKARLVATVSEADAENRRFRFKTRPCAFPGSSFRFVIDVNGVRAFDRFISSSEPYASQRGDLVSVSLSPGTLQAGDNTFDVYAELDSANPDVTTGWVRLDYYALEAGRERQGLAVILK